MESSPSLSRRLFLAACGLAAAPLVRAARPLERVPAGKMLGLVPADDFMFSPGLAYLNTGSLGPSPRPVLERMAEIMKEIQRNPTYYAYFIDEQRMDETRGKAAAFLGCKLEEIVLTQCTTAGMNAVASSMALKAGDHVLTTDQEHPGGRVCWDYMARTQGIVIDIVVIPPGENDGQAIIDRFAKAITPQTKVVMFSHLLSSTGLRMPVKELTDLARSRGCISVVDGAQAPGGIEVNVRALGCDVYVTSGHKWLMGPPGTGLLYLGEGIGKRVDPIAIQANRNAYSASSGVTNIPGVVGLGVAIDYLSAIGMNKIEAHNMELRNRLFDKLRGVSKLEVVSAPPGSLASPLLSYRLPEVPESSAFQVSLREKHNIQVKMVPKNWFHGHRISSHVFTTGADLDRLTKALQEELR